MASMAGSINPSAPKRRRHATERTAPKMALLWEASLRHCSKKITTNMAVITKSSPSVLMVRTPPNSPPSVAPSTQ